MARKRAAIKRTVDPDPKYMDVVVTRFINTLMYGGKKSTAEKILYSSIERLEQATNEGGIKAFRKALDNVKPALEVKSRRVGGATYQVPVEVKPARRQSLATRWIIEASRGRPEKNMAERLAAELIEAFHGRGGAMKKREDVHRMAEANKAFSHFRW